VAQKVLLFLCCAGLNPAVGQYAPTAHEQYQLEVINRARANPLAEVARLSGVTWGDTGAPRSPSLNEGLAPGTISTAAKPPLAFSPKLIKSARDYSNLCLSANGWGHNFGGTTPGSRMTAAGYAFTGTWSYAENIAWSGSTGAYPITVPVVDYLYEILFVDGDVPGRGHRINLMDAGTKEIGIGLGTGANYKGGGSGTGYNAAFVTQDFAVSSGNSFLTGVVFKDSDGNDFYSPGEGIGGVTVTAVPAGGGSNQAVSTWSSGGYTLQLAPGTYNVSAAGDFGTVNMGGISISSANVKLDARILAAWRSAQLTASPNAAAGNRTGAAHSGAHLYFYKGTDSNIWASFWNGGQWAQAPLTSDANVDDWLTFGTAYNLLCYKGADNRLWVMYFNGSVWAAAPLGTNANVAGDVVMDSAWNLIHYRGTDGRVWTTWWTGSQWAQASLGGSANVAGSLGVDSRHHVVLLLDGRCLGPVSDGHHGQCGRFRDCRQRRRHGLLSVLGRQQRVGSVLEWQCMGADADRFTGRDGCQQPHHSLQSERGALPQHQRPVLRGVLERRQMDKRCPRRRRLRPDGRSQRAAQRELDLRPPE
jgi:Cysteine-rich secretory protein family